MPERNTPEGLTWQQPTETPPPLPAPALTAVGVGLLDQLVPVLSGGQSFLSSYCIRDLPTLQLLKAASLCAGGDRCAHTPENAGARTGLRPRTLLGVGDQGPRDCQQDRAR